MAFMRAYGMGMGDPGPRPAPKRKSAGAGPRAKAGRKRVVRSQRAARGHQGGPRGPGGRFKKKGFDLGGAIKGAGQFIGAHAGQGLDIAQQFIPGGAIASKLGINLSGLLPAQAAAAAAAAGATPEEVAAVTHAAHQKSKGGGRKRKNPANVKALRHALGRVEGFGRLVKRVNRMLPTSHKYAVHPVMKHKRKRRSA